MDTKTDKRIVMTLDAGGTNFVFSAVQSNKEIIDPMALPSNAKDLDLCLKTILKGFEQTKAKLKSEPVAISFAFPGPADYKNGIIGDLGNLPAFRGGIALGPMLEDRFHLPVFINNDGDLFAYGEAISGLLPWVNEKLRQAGKLKQFKNIIGVTLGTGFGGGLIVDGDLLTGDNNASGEVWLLRNKLHRDCYAEESISIRAVVRVYKSKSKITVEDNITPQDIYEVATGKRAGDQVAARESFKKLGDALGDALANMINMVDGLVVVGGGLSRAWEFFAPDVISHINGTINTLDGQTFPRSLVTAFNIEEPRQMENFLAGQEKEILVPYSSRKVVYDPYKRTAIGLSRLGTSEAVSIGAYAYALNAIDKNTASV